MRVSEIVCVVILTIIMAGSTVHANNEPTTLQMKARDEKKISKREAIVLTNHHPDTLKSILHPYISSRKKAPKIRLKMKHRDKRYRYRHPSHKRRPNPMINPYYRSEYGRKPKPRYWPNSRKPSLSKKLPHHMPAEPVHFRAQDGMPRPTSYGEPPTEVYNDIFFNLGYDQISAKIPKGSYGKDYQQLQSDENFSYSDLFGNSQKHPQIKAEDDYQDLVDLSIDYRDYDSNVNKDKLNSKKNKKYQHLTKSKYKPKRQSKPQQNNQIIVGGQYAEPPARYVPKVQPSTYDMLTADNFSVPPNGFLDNDMAGSSVSSYVNYKHSNMAFSPQNLNDAFSIID